MQSFSLVSSCFNVQDMITNENYCSLLSYKITVTRKKMSTRLPQRSGCILPRLLNIFIVYQKMVVCTLLENVLANVLNGHSEFKPGQLSHPSCSLSMPLSQKRKKYFLLSPALVVSVDNTYQFTFSAFLLSHFGKPTKLGQNFPATNQILTV